MVQEDRNEIWQVEVGGTIYEAPLAELPDWINEGSLLPDDKVRKGNLRWIEAKRVPSLIPFFNAKTNGEPMPVVQTVTDGSNPAATVSQEPVPQTTLLPSPILTPAAVPPAKGPAPAASSVRVCSRHSDREASYICSGCSHEFCKACPSSYGGSVRICPDCGSLCRSDKEESKKRMEESGAAGLQGESFGISDLSRAFAYPFRFKPSLIFGGLMFMFFTLGQSASALGGAIFISASIFCAMLANMLTFGVLSNTVDNFTQGKFDADFMPNFDDFSMWDDVIHPFLLSIGVYISSFGPFILAAVIGAYLVVSAVGEQTEKYKQELSSVPGTQFYSPDRTAAQTKEVNELLKQVKQQNLDRLRQQQKAVESAAAGDEQGAVPPETVTQEQIDQLDRELKIARAAQGGPAASEPAADQISYRETLARTLQLAAPLVVLGMITLLWGLIYFPAACAVAGYTRSFTATINPLVGLDTMRRLGLAYVKILAMGLIIMIATGVIAFALQLVLFPFNLPGVGNIPATALGSIATFYFWVVFWCVLGFALFKNADRLKLYR